MACAAALTGRGLQVELFEARKKLGGRAGSYIDRATGEAIDHCQHVAMGCCTNFADFCRRTQIDGLFICYREAGPNNAPTLLLLHGLPSSSRMFEPRFSRLSDRYRLVAHHYPVCSSVC